MKTKILIVDDHPYTRNGIKAIVEASKTNEVVGEAVDGNDAIIKVQEKQPDIVIMDINMPGLSGIEATKRILSANSHVKIIGLSMHSGEFFVKEMLNAGAAGYILKDNVPDELLRAIDSVIKGDMFLSSNVTQAALKKEDHLILLQTKLHRPPVMDDYVIREKIINELEKNIVKPLSVISAGAGFGKSITVSQWLEQTKYLHTWISLDKEHNDFRIFLIYFCAAINKIFPNALSETNNLLKTTILPSRELLLNSLINDIYDIDQDFIIVLDDYHLIKEHEIHEFFDEWFRFPPANVHLSILTRRDPPIKTDTLRANGLMTEVRMDKLCFNDEEVACLYKKLLDVNLSNQSLKLLQEKTEGWIIGLRLISMVIKNQEDIESILKKFDEGLYSISDYLISEVLSKHSEQYINYITTLSILDRFCVELLDELLQTENVDNKQISKGSEIIQWLLKSNMFIISLDLEQKWFRFHHLFQDLLKFQLKEEKPLRQIQIIYKRASNWFEKNNLIIEAIEYAIEADDIDLAIQIILKHWEIAFESDDWYIVDEWMKLLPVEEMNQSYDLLFVRLWITQKRHTFTHFPKLIELIEQREGDLNNARKGYLAFAKCLLNLFSSEGEKAIANAEQALQLIPKKHYIFRADVRGWRTAALQIAGQGDRAIELAKEAVLKTTPFGKTVLLARYTMHPNFVLILKADLSSLKREIEEFFKIPKISTFMLGWGWYFRGSISWWSNDMENVVKNLKNLIPIKYQIRPSISIDAFVYSALALQDLNKPEKAKQMISDSILFAKYSDNPANEAIASSGQARLNLLQGNLKDAENWLSKTEYSALNPSNFWWVEIPAITRCRVLIAQSTNKSLHEALEILKGYLTYTKSIYNNLRSIEVAVLLALTNLKLKDLSAAKTNLQYALVLTADDQWIRPFVEAGEPIRDLLEVLKNQNIKPDLIDNILKAVNEKAATISLQKNGVKTNETIESNTLAVLTWREMEILRYIDKGLQNKEIAEKLFRSKETIKKHIYHMFKKLKVKSRFSLVIEAKKQGLL